MPKLKNEQREQFCHEMLVSSTQVEAALRAGYAPRSAQQMSSYLLQQPEIQGRIAELRRGVAEKVEKLGITPEQVIVKWWMIANHDPNELSQNRTGACRYCYGIGHQYQWKTEREFRQECDNMRAKLRLEPDQIDPRVPTDEGGYGYNIKTKPDPDCPECNGLGVTYQVFPDSTQLSPSAMAAYQGVKVTQRGLEVQTESKSEALNQVAKHLGMFIDRKEIDASASMKAFLDSIMGSKAPLGGRN